MRVHAFRLVQRGHSRNVEIYVCVFRAGDLVHLCEIDRRTPDNPGGYQRQPSERRLSMLRGSALRYLVRELGCFPTSILLNVRGEVVFHEERDLGWYSLGVLEPVGEEFWIIDGQHRVEALKRAIARNRDFEDYPVIASVLRLPDRFDEMLLFYIVNRRQRGVSTDLVYRHLQRMLLQKGEEWLLDLEGLPGLKKGYAIEVIDVLNQEPVSPWFGRIREVGEQANPNHLVRDRDFMSSVLAILEQGYFKNMPIVEIAHYLIDYWNALYNLYPECFAEPRSYSLLIKPGMPALNLLFPDVYGMALRGGDVSEEAMFNVLTGLLAETPEHRDPDFQGPLGLEFWSLDRGSSRVLGTTKEAINQLYENLQLKIWLARQ